MLSAFISKLKFCAALLVAAAFSDVGSASGWRRVWRALALWFGGLKPGAKASSTLIHKRMEICRACPLWFKPLETCGSPLRREDADLGCWCFMPVKAGLVEAECWLDMECGDDAPFSWKSNGL